MTHEQILVLTRFCMMVVAMVFILLLLFRNSSKDGSFLISLSSFGIILMTFLLGVEYDGTLNYHICLICWSYIGFRNLEVTIMGK